MDERYSYCFQTKPNNFEMVSDYQGRSSTHIPHSAGIGCFSQPLHFDRYMGEERGRLQHQHLQGDQHGLSSHQNPHPHLLPRPRPHPHPHPHLLSSSQPHDLREAIYREIEKERIRQDIIMSEILRRRALEAEVRRKMRNERELALRGSNAIPFGSPSPMENRYHH